MDPEQFKKLEASLNATIHKTISKKVDPLQRKLDDHMRDFRTYVQEDIDWKEDEVARNKPVVDAFNNTSWLFKLFISALKTVGLLGTAGGVLVGLYYALKTWVMH